MRLGRDARTTLFIPLHPVKLRLRKRKLSQSEVPSMLTSTAFLECTEWLGRDRRLGSERK